MKVEKDNAMDKADKCELSAKDAKRKATKAEEEVAGLMKKSCELEMELGKATEDLVSTTQKLEEKEKSLLCSELEVNSLNRKV